MANNLGRLEPVDLREAWGREDQEFTPWLAQEGNLAELGRAIGMELELVSQEQNVGAYRADVLCKDSLTQGYVLIENQLEKTDHAHLGQILTYAAGVGAKTVVWIAKRVTDEHRAALDWLNEITEENYGFFALEIELWKIGDSPPAPKFNVVCKPNDWRRTIVDSTQSGEIPESKKLYHSYWTEFREFLLQRQGTPLRPQKASSDNWTNYAIGRGGFWLSAVASIEQGWIGAELFIRPSDMDPKDAFRRLERERAAIEADTGFALEWDELPEKKGSRIAIYLTEVELKKQDDWPRQFEWLAGKLERLERALRKRVRAL